MSEGFVRTTASLGVVRAERDWNRDEYGIFRFGEDAYGRACVTRFFEELDSPKKNYDGYEPDVCLDACIFADLCASVEGDMDGGIRGGLL